MPGSSCVRGATADEAAIRDYCRDRIAHYKVPRYVRFVDAFPMTVTGKIQKFVMRQAMSEAAWRAGTENGVTPSFEGFQNVCG